jgi:hypothetical protein
MKEAARADAGMGKLAERGAPVKEAGETRVFDLIHKIEKMRKGYGHGKARLFLGDDVLYNTTYSIGSRRKNF